VPSPPTHAPRRSSAKRSTKKAIGTVEAKARVLVLLAQGLQRAEAMAAVNRTTSAYLEWRKIDPEFRAAVDELRQARAAAAEAGVQPVPDFETFCREWLHEPLFPHHLRILDAIEGREPRDLHPSMVYTPGRPGRIICNVPPGHGKTTQFSVNYPVWLIHKNPNIQIIIVSKSQKFAEKILGAIKQKLTSPLYRDLHFRFAPEGGWKDPDSSWTQTAIYVQGKGGGKDPTVQALGISGQIYGARADLIILDDAVTMSNVTAHEAQRDWVMQEVSSRLPPGEGKLVLLGTRVAPVDLYSVMQDEEMFGGRGNVFGYLSQPAVLDYHGDDPSDWETLWPWAVNPDGTPMERWTGENLANERTNERKWALVYQQQTVSDDAIFPQGAVEAAINRLRLPGVLHEGVPGVRSAGMQGLYVIGGLDPATVGHTAMQVWGLDRAIGKRYVLDGFDKANCTPRELREQVKRLTLLHGINEWVIERNAFQRFLTQDPELKDFLFAHACRLTEHHTNSEKLDPDFGVMSMAPLFMSCGSPQEGNRGGIWSRNSDPDKALIELPNPRQNLWVQDLIAQLIVWQPSGMRQKQKTDLVMAGWFCEIACKRILGYGQKKITHMHNPFAATGLVRSRTVVNLAEVREQQLSGRRAG
jgi:hypothetical protein